MNKTKIGAIDATRADDFIICRRSIGMNRAVRRSVFGITCYKRVCMNKMCDFEFGIYGNKHDGR